MMKQAFVFSSAVVLAATTWLACGDDGGSDPDPDAAVADAAQEPDSVVRLTFIHLNDIYEITPISGGTRGGLARVATLKAQLAEQNPNTYVTFGGDLYGPSGLSGAMVDGELLAGRHMVAVMNATGIDYSNFGDHEFDEFPADQILARIAETEYTLIASNILAEDGSPLENTVRNVTFTASNSDGASVTVGMFSVIEEFQSDLTLTRIDRIEAVTEQVNELEDQVDILVGLTHNWLPDDEDTATQFPAIDLILGGDEHENLFVEPGDGLAPIFKADSNARTAYIIDLAYDTATDELTIDGRLQVIDPSIEEDPDVKAVNDMWVQVGFDALRDQGIEPTTVVGTPGVDVDGLASSIRNRSTGLTEMLCDGFAVATGSTVDIGFVRSGQIRLDDVIPAGSDFTEYDVLRTFPADEQVAAVEMPGSTLLQLFLEPNITYIGTGGYSHFTSNVVDEGDGTFTLDGNPIDPATTYSLAMSAGFAAAIAGALPDVTVRDTYPTTIHEVLRLGVANL